MAPTARLGYSRPANMTPWTTSATHEDPARRLLHFLGAHRPHWLSTAPVPVFLSLASVVRYEGRGDQWAPRKPDGFACGLHALDSGAYSALMTDGPNADNHPWFLAPDEFGALVTRVIEQNGMPPIFAAIQDAPCEPQVLAKTGRTVRGNIFESVESYLYLCERFPFVPWLPTLQGWEPEHYLMCAELYERHGVDLAAAPYVGLGSVCRRDAGETANVVRVVEALAPLKYRLHGFGMSIDALREVGHRMTSADSMAWSYAARMRKLRLDGCEHVGDCRNCLTWALEWRETVFGGIRAGARAREAEAAATRSPLARLLADAHAAPLPPAQEQLTLVA